MNDLDDGGTQLLFSDLLVESLAREGNALRFCRRVDGRGYSMTVLGSDGFEDW